jgi:NAD(P)-dependent dehydrogenase (short-subunit alcohol dehydrogenase family)
VRHALITGITGQDGSYLAEHLLAEGYEVWGLAHRQANPQTRRLLREVHIIRGDLLDKESLLAAVEHAEPDEVYNLAAISTCRTAGIMRSSRHVLRDWGHCMCSRRSGSTAGLPRVPCQNSHNASELVISELVRPLSDTR